MSNILIKSKAIPSNPRSKNYPAGITVVSSGGGGTSVVTGGGGTSVDVLKVDDLRSLTDRNVFSSLRTLDEIRSRIIAKGDIEIECTDDNALSSLRTLDEIDKAIVDVLKLLEEKYISKLHDDTASGHLTLEQGASSAGLLEANGGLVVRKEELFEAALMSLTEESDDSLIEEVDTSINPPGVNTLGGLTNVNNDADQTSATDDLLVRLAGSTEWTVKPANEIAGSDFQFDILPQEDYDLLATKEERKFYFIADRIDKTIPKLYIGELLFAAGIGGGGSDDILIDTILLDKYELTLDASPERLISTFLPDNATSKTLVWSSSDLAVATVTSAGIVTPTNNGNCIVTVRAARGGASAEAIVTVSISVRSVEIKNTETILKQGEPIQLQTEVLPANAGEKSLSYTSSDPEVASVSKSGLITHLKDGDVTIEVQSKNNMRDSISLRALTPVRGINITNKIASLDIGETYQFHSEFTPASPTNKNYAWATSDVNIASMNNGLVSALSKGNVLISITSEDGGLKDENPIRIILPVTGLQINGNSKAVFGYDIQLGYIPIPSDADIDVLEWSVSDPTLAGISSTGLLTPKVSSGTFIVTVREAKHNVSATFSITLAALAIRSIVCEEGETVNNVFTNWNVDVIGNATKLTYKEYAGEALLQSGEITLPIADNKLPIELYAEFGPKRIEFTASNSDGDTEHITKEVLYQEPELVTYNFDIDVQCTQEQAQAMSMEIPYYKYDKKFVYNLRNDDNLTSLWRMAFRYCNREILPKMIKRFERNESELESLGASERRRSPRRLGYTNGCGVLIPFVFDTAGIVQDENGLTFDSGQNTMVQREDILKMRDYGAHFLLHNMKFFDSDPVKPKYDNDYSYPLQRDREVLFREFGYTSVTYANPDGDPYYTQPCIKDPKTLLMSGGGYALSTPEQLASGVNGSSYGERFPDAVKYYGLPAHRQAFSWDSDLSNLSLSEIRNTLNTRYVYSENHPFRSNLWKTQYQMALAGKPSLATELTHGLGYDLESNGTPNLESTALLKQDMHFFEEVFDVCGANGNDMIWFCPADESIEYMYYQRVAKITKTLTQTGCRFTINIQIPDYLSYKTYSVIIRNLPETAVVTRGQGVTAFHKNMQTGLINFGYSVDIPERAGRYVQQYLNNKTNDNLDRAWYFVRQLGELQTPYASQLPEFNEKPVLDSVSIPGNLTSNEITVTTTNANKEFGEANSLEVSNSPDFDNIQSYVLSSGQHKWHDSLDAECLKNDFKIVIPFLFNQQQILYFRLKNIYGLSAVKSAVATINRVEGVNDPFIELIPNLQFKNDEYVECTVNYRNVNVFRYKLDDGSYNDWNTLVSKLNIPMSIGTHTVEIQGKNNLNEITEHIIDINYTGKQIIILFANVTTSNAVEGIGFVNRVKSAASTIDNVYDLEGNIVFKAQGLHYQSFKTQIDKFREKYKITAEKNITEAYWDIPDLTEENGRYPNILITNGGKKEIRMYGGIQPDSTYQTVKYFTEVPAGIYKVKMLLSAKASASYKYPNIIRAQNQTISIPAEDSAKVINNNQYWYEFNNVVVDADGFLLVSQYTDVMLAVGTYRLSPIVLLEITKI